MKKNYIEAKKTLKIALMDMKNNATDKNMDLDTEDILSDVQDIVESVFGISIYLEIEDE